MNLWKSFSAALLFQMICMISWVHAEIEPSQTQPDGYVLYANKCANCHQINGEGVPPAYPPLAASDFLQNWSQGKERKKLVAILKKGLKGSITVNGVAYNGFMPPAAKDLTDAEIATLLTYVTNSWGNQAEPFSEEEVRSFGFLEFTSLSFVSR